MQSLSDINPRGETTTTDRTTMATRSPGTPNTNSEGAITGRQRTKKGPQRNDHMQGNNSSAGHLTEDNIHRIAPGVIQHPAKANVTNNSNGNEQGLAEPAPPYQQRQLHRQVLIPPMPNITL